MRYNNNKILNDDNGVEYLNRSEYPVIPIRDSDIIINGKFGQRFDQLAFQYYGDQELWWIIARANNQSDSMYLVIGKEYRIPQEIGLITQQLRELNK
jgi:hypothetical protein|tara:strand:- start:59 stop:349 length:291 start_codon:yes stop_codon:yes gene_type:complete